MRDKRRTDRQHTVAIHAMESESMIDEMGVTADWWATASPDENNLISYLFDQQDYNPLIRPVKNRSETIDVFFEMALIQLITLVRRHQQLQPYSNKHLYYVPHPMAGLKHKH